MIQKPDRNWATHGRIVGVDFEAKTLEFRFEGDLKPLVVGRYAIIPAATLLSLSMLAAKAIPSRRAETTGSAGTEGSAVSEGDLP